MSRQAISTRWAGIGLLLALAASSSLAYVWPRLISLSGAETAWDPFHLEASSLWLLVSTTMFCLGSVVSRHELSQLRERPTSLLLGVATQCLCMPALAWLAVALLRIEGELAAGIILVGCVPGAMASNVLTLTARGNVSYSVSLTSVATLLSPITVPLALLLVGGIPDTGTSLDPARTAKLLALTVVLPVALGFALKELWSPLSRLAKQLAPHLASIALLWIIASVVGDNRERLAQIEPRMLAALALINVAGYAAGALVGAWANMPIPMRRALSLEVGMQNAGVGTALAASLFGAGSAAQIPTAAYTFGCMLTGTLLAGYWAAAAVDDVAESLEPRDALPTTLSRRRSRDS